MSSSSIEDFVKKPSGASVGDSWTEAGGFSPVLLGDTQGEDSVYVAATVEDSGSEPSQHVLELPARRCGKGSIAVRRLLASQSTQELSQGMSQDQRPQ